MFGIVVPNERGRKTLAPARGRGPGSGWVLSGMLTVATNPTTAFVGPMLSEETDMHSSQRNRRRGFSLVELMVTVAILATIVAIAVPLFTRTKRKNDLRYTAQRMVSHFAKARTFATSGKSDVPTWPQGTRARTAGIRFISATQYAIFVDQDGQDNGAATEADVEVVDIAASGEPFQFVAPPTSVRFRRNGTLTASPDVNITLRDTETAEQRVVRVTFGGKASLFL